MPCPYEKSICIRIFVNWYKAIYNQRWLHNAAALSVDTEEFVTAEKTTKPMHSVTEITAIVR